MKATKTELIPKGRTCPECGFPLNYMPYQIADHTPWVCSNRKSCCGSFSDEYLDKKIRDTSGPQTNEALPSSTNPKDLIGDTKPDLSLVPPALLIHCAVVMGLGANKYGPYNWRSKKVRTRVYVAAALRHLARYADGEDNDPESGTSHLAHAAACCGIILDAQSCADSLIDDRPKAGPESKLISRFTQKKL